MAEIYRRDEKKKKKKKSHSEEFPHGVLIKSQSKVVKQKPKDFKEKVLLKVAKKL